MALWQRGDPACSRPCREDEADDPVLLKGLRRPLSPPGPQKKPVKREACLEHGFNYLPLDMFGFTPQEVENPKACQLLCAEQPGGAFYSYFAPTRSCHCEAEVGVRHTGWGFISGSTSCDHVKQHPDTELIRQHMHDACYEAEIGYIDVIIQQTSWQAMSVIWRALSTLCVSQFGPKLSADWIWSIKELCCRGCFWAS
eukprot:symbB.v1.2.003913.t1/scaffold210.1/size302740/4